MMKNIGIWIDKEKAHIITIEDTKEQMITVTSNIDHYNVTGGSRSKVRWGPQQVVHDSKYLEREKHQIKNYFKEIAKIISNADAIAIYGPADTNFKLEKELKSNYKDIGQKIKEVKKTDSMTINQIKAMVNDYYSS